MHVCGCKYHGMLVAVRGQWFSPSTMRFQDLNPCQVGSKCLYLLSYAVRPRPTVDLKSPCLSLWNSWHDRPAL